MEKNKSREQSTRSDVVRQLKAVRKEQHITQEVLAEREGVFIANYNCPGQLVITGVRSAVGQARRNPIFPDWRAEDIIQVWIFW